MMKMRLAIWLVCLFSMVVIAVPAMAVDYYALEDVYPGLKGTGKTVIEGTRIDEFVVEVIDVVPQGGFDGGPMILAKFTGPVIDVSKGIAAGYSGSPVYFDGKLAGAVSSATPGTDLHIGGITPISSMLPSLDSAEATDFKDKTVLPPAYTQFSTGPGGPVIPETPKVPRVIWTTDWTQAEIMNRAGTGALYAVPLMGELLIGGATPQAFERILPIVKSNPLLANLTPVRSVAGPGPEGFGLLKPHAIDKTMMPGDAMSFALVTGDFDITALGTLTYIDDQNRVLALGHSMFSTGAANIPFGKAYVVYTYYDLSRGFKDGFMINQIGTITKDKAAGVGGRVGVEPDMVDVVMNVNDIDTHSKRSFNFKVIRQKELFETLVYMIATQAFVEQLNRDGGGTVRIGYEIDADGLSEPFSRENYFYDEYNAVSFLAAEALPTAALIIFNNYREMKIKRFTLNVDVTKNRMNASIDKAEIVTAEGAGNGQGGGEEAGKETKEPAPAGQAPPEQKETSGVQEGQDIKEPAPPITEEEGAKTATDLKIKEFMPGEIVRLKVKIQPFRKDAFVQELTIRIPRDFPEGATSIIVQSGGGLVSVYNEFGGKGTVLFPAGGGPLPLGPEILSIDQALEKIKKGETNNQLLIVIPRPPTPEQQQAEAQGVSTEGVIPDEEKQVKVTVPTDYVLYDTFMIPINIVKQKTAKPQGAEPSAPAGGA